MQLIYLLLKSERVYEKSKQRLRLSEVGHWGLANLMCDYDISVPMIKRFIEQVCLTGGSLSQLYMSLFVLSWEALRDTFLIKQLCPLQVRYFLEPTSRSINRN